MTPWVLEEDAVSQLSGTTLKAEFLRGWFWADEGDGMEPVDYLVWYQMGGGDSVWPEISRRGYSRRTMASI